jgi:hypothetical protein
MLINVAFDGKKMFDWEGDAGAIARIDEEMLRIAKLGNATPSDLSQPTLTGISRNGGFFTPNPQVEVMIVVWTLISMPTGDPDRPGLVRDYLEAWNFDFDIEIDPDNENKVRIAVNGGFTAKGTA